MLDIKFILENPEAHKQGAIKKHIDCDVDKVIELYEEYKPKLQKIEELRAKQNEVSKQIPQAENKDELLKEMAPLKQELKDLEAALPPLEEKINEAAAKVPNIPAEDVPEGKDDTLNVVIHTHGEKTKFDFEPKNHIDLGTELDILNIEKATEMSGARFYYLKNQGALLEMALINFVFQKLTKKGFSAIIPPVLVREQAMFATGFFPADRNEIYSVNPGEDDLFLIGTSEVPLTMLHANEKIDVSTPKRYFAFSPCFRREAGSYGKDTTGIIRVHQFNKVEMFSFCHPNDSDLEHEELVAIEEEIFQELELPYQAMMICGGDLGAPAHKKVDLEAWVPTQDKFREVTSCSNCTDFQARRTNIKFKNEEGKNEYVHTLNGTAIAIPRAFVSIIENNQQSDGSVIIPKVLRPFMLDADKIEKA